MPQSATPPASRPGPRCLYVIHNPTAGQRRQRLYRRTLEALSALGCDVETVSTTCRGDGERLARAAADGSWDAVVAAGGDGTINEVVNGLAGSAMPLGIVSLGTANVFAAEIGLPVRARAMAEALARGPFRQVHVGRANGRAFGLMIGVGHDAHAVATVDPRIKRQVGKLAYVLSAARRILADAPQVYEVEVDGETFRAASVVVAKGHFYAGRFVVAPAARLDAPSFEVCMAERPGRLNTLRYGLALVLGRLPKLADYRIVTGRRIRIVGPQGDPVQGDGDILTVLPVTVELEPRPLTLIVPGT